jgi:DNA helicase HerA-like ATPase
VLGQLGNRVQHALRAFTPRDQKAVATAAETLRPNPAFDAAAAITELGVGEALVSFLDEKGRPTVVERAFILPPASRIGPLDAGERQAVIQSSLVYGVYEKALDRESAYEKLRQCGCRRSSADGCERRCPFGALRNRSAGSPRHRPAAAVRRAGRLGDLLGGTTSGHAAGAAKAWREALAKSAARAIGSQVGREIIRGVLGSMLGGSTRRR